MLEILVQPATEITTLFRPAVVKGCIPLPYTQSSSVGVRIIIGIAHLYRLQHQLQKLTGNKNEKMKALKAVLSWML